MSSETANNILRVIMVEDEAPARQKLSMQLAQINEVELIAKCDNPTSAISEINTLKPDLVLLDIELGSLNGFDVLDAIVHPCHVIFTTAYSDYAVKAFENRALDYLLKPFNLARLKEALSRIPRQVSANSKDENTAEKITVASFNETSLISKVGDKMRVLNFDDIAYIATCQGICSAFTNGKEHNLEHTLESLSSKLPAHFVRVHRNCIVNLNRIEQIERWQNGCYLLRFKDVDSAVTTSRSGASEIKHAFNL